VQSDLEIPFQSKSRINKFLGRKMRNLPNGHFRLLIGGKSVRQHNLINFIGGEDERRVGNNRKVREFLHDNSFCCIWEEFGGFNSKSRDFTQRIEINLQCKQVNSAITSRMKVDWH
jgi:hypothetical protein